MKLSFKTIVGALWVAATAAPVFGASISSFFPAYADTAGASYITIIGSGFLGGALEVRFNGTLAASAYVSTQDGTQIQARLASGTPAGSGPITVKVGNGTPASSASYFTVVGSGPYIHTFTPNAGSGSAKVTLVGLHLSTVTNVSFSSGRTAIGGLPPTSDSEIVVTAPADVLSGPITARSPQGVYTTTDYFYVPPVISSFSSTNGRAGTNFLVRGTNFVGTSSVLFAGPSGPFTLPAAFNVQSNRGMIVTVPEGARTGKLRMFTPAGSADSPAIFVLQPLISSFSPGFGGVNTPVLITGANLDAGTPVVRFNGVAASVSGVGFGQLTAYVPAGATTGPISVQTTNGTYTTLNNFYLPPSITSFAPNNSPPGSRVTITGQNFLDATSVSFDALPAASFFVTNNTTIGATVPEGVNSGLIRVITPGGLATSTANFFAPPFIESFVPTHGQPGTLVTLSGSNFLGATAVRFNGLNAASYNVINNFTIQATVPGGAQTGPITVAAPAGTNTTTEVFSLDYLNDLNITMSDAPDPVDVSSNLVYTIYVGNNGPSVATDIKVTNTLPATVVVTSAIASQGTLQTYGSQVVADLGSLTVGNSAWIAVTVKPQTEGNIEALATVTSFYPDPQPGNNSAITSTTVVPLALLKIRFMNDRVRVSWPLTLDEFSLHYQQPLSATGAWSSVTTPPFTFGNERVVVETNAGPAKFYRLIK